MKMVRRPAGGIERTWTGGGRNGRIEGLNWAFEGVTAGIRASIWTDLLQIGDLFDAYLKIRLGRAWINTW